MDFITLDKELKKYPKQISKLIYNYYKLKCDICNIHQIFCSVCEKYHCKCSKDIIRCNVNECNKLLCCALSIRIQHNNGPCLCEKCWNS